MVPRSARAGRRSSRVERVSPAHDRGEASPRLGGARPGGDAMTELCDVNVTINGAEHRLSVAPSTVLADVLRETLGLTGTKLSCDQGVCGACTVLIDGKPM